MNCCRILFDIVTSIILLVILTCNLGYGGTLAKITFGEYFELYKEHFIFILSQLK